MGRELWIDAVAHLRRRGGGRRCIGRRSRVVRLVDTLEADAGLNRIDRCRRWLHELGFTVPRPRRGGAEAT